MRVIEFNGRNYGKIMDFTDGKAYVSAKPGSEVHLYLKTLDGITEINKGDFVIKKEDTYGKRTLKELMDENF